MYLFNIFNESEGNDHIINISTCFQANPHFCKNFDFKNSKNLLLFLKLSHISLEISHKSK